MHVSTRSTKGNCVWSLPSSSPAASSSVPCTMLPASLSLSRIPVPPPHALPHMGCSCHVSQFKSHIGRIFWSPVPKSIPQHRAWDWEILALCVHSDPVTQSSWETQLLTIHDSSIVSTTQSTVPWEESQWETVSIRLAFGCVWGIVLIMN